MTQHVALSPSLQSRFEELDKHISRLRATLVEPTTMASEPVKDKGKAKMPVESVYPSPADDIRHMMSPPVQEVQRYSPSPKVTLPSLRDIIPPLSPSHSPQDDVQNHTFTPINRANNPQRESSSVHLADPQLFPEHQATRNDQPLFSTTHSEKEKRQEPAKHFNRRQWKRPVQRAHSPPTRTGYYGTNNAFSRAREDPQWGDKMGKELDVYFPRTPQSTPLQAPEKAQEKASLGKRKRDSITGSTSTGTLRQKTAKKDVQPSPSARIGTRASPRDAPQGSFFQTVLDTTVGTEDKAAATGQAAKRPKQVRKGKDIEPDWTFEKYEDFAPAISTLDESGNFTANWGGKPIPLDDDPQRHLLHEKEVKLATKLSLTAGRYLYLKRRFFEGRLVTLRKNEVYNINRAQLYNKGDDRFGVQGNDVNRTSALWKAYDSVGWLDPKHMQSLL